MDEAEKRELSNSYINLREHFEMLFKERDKNLDLRFKSLSDALTLAAGNVKEKLEELNNLRREYTDDRTKDQQRYIIGDVYYPKVKTMDEWKEKVDKQLTTINTRTVTTASIMGIVFVIIQIAIAFWKR